MYLFNFFTVASADASRALGMAVVATIEASQQPALTGFHPLAEPGY